MMSKFHFFLLSIFLLTGLQAHNFVLNGSFEFASTPGLPDGWGPGHWGLYYWQDQPETWRECFRASKEHAFDGEWSLMLDKRPDTPSLAAYSCFIRPAHYLKNVSKWTFSTYVYAEQNGEVVLSILDNYLRKLTTKSFQVPPRVWTRLSLDSKISVNSVVLYVGPKTDGKFFFDAVQFEENELTPYANGIFDQLRLKPVIYGNTAPEFIADPKLSVESAEIKPLQYSHRTFYRAGKPFIPYAFGMDSKKTSPELMRRVREIGFNTVFFFYRNLSNTDFFDEAARAGLYVIPLLLARTSELSDMIKAQLNNPSIVVWKVIDEPLRPFDQQVLERETIAKAVDSTRPILINYRTNEINQYMKRLAELPGQIISCDQYPLGNFEYPGSVMDCAELIGKMETKLASAGKPLWNWFQITGNAYMNSREPTPAEYELMLYSSLIAGCRGFITFQNQPLSEELWRTVGRIGLEFQALAPVVYGAETAPPPSDPNIMMLARRYNAENYLICVNRSTRRIDVDFKMNADMEVLFEQRTIRGKDSFEPYQRHVYRWK